MKLLSSRAVRTPLGSFEGSLAGIGATDLGAIVIEEAVSRAGIEKSDVNEVILGQVLPLRIWPEPRQTGRHQGGPAVGKPSAFTINKVCGSPP
jgi:acetyl-CoA C-acetyltransferase